MCLALIALNASARYPLLIIGNRDEAHARDTANLHWWQEPPGIIAGRDLIAGGTWLGISRSGQFGLVTNYREQPSQVAAKSRGQLLGSFLTGSNDPLAYADKVTYEDYAGFNLLIGQFNKRCAYLTNRSDERTRTLGSGIHALSNALLDTPWPKLVRVREAVADWLETDHADPEALFAPLRDTRQSAEPDTPDVDLPEQALRALTAPFIVSPEYGTRSTSLVLVEPDGAAQFLERRFAPDGSQSGQSEEHFRIEM
ncbi:MAG: NRDE family protein [Pseudomonadota bacterium]